MSAAIDLGLATLRLEQDGRVLTAYYSNPPSNYVKAALLRDLDLLTRTVEDDRTVGAVVIASDVAGRFLSHVDANELEALSDAPGPELGVSQALPLWKVINAALGLGATNVAARAGHVGAGLLTSHRWKKAVLRMNRSRCVYLAALSGPTLGGGHELALACDLRYAADDPSVMLGQIEILAGVVPGGGGTQRLARIVGTARALELVLEGAPVDVHRAAELGLIHRVVPAEALLREAQAAAARLATRSPVAVREAKRLIYAATDRPLTSGLDHELAAFLSTGSTAFAKRAFGKVAADHKTYGESPFVANPEPWIDGRRLQSNLNES